MPDYPRGRPEVCVLPDGRIGLFLGSSYKFVSVAEARGLAERLAEAIQQAETSTCPPT